MGSGASVFARSARDVKVASAALIEGVAVAGTLAWAARADQGAGPGALVLVGVAVAVMVWWTSNTIAHLHLHGPLFRSRGANRAFSIYLGALTGVPQTLWRRRHLWHHAGEPLPRRRALSRERRQELSEGFVIALAAAVWLALAPRLFVLAVAPGYLAGLLLCQAQGHYEHAAGRVGGVSHYGALYNVIWFNDGYHVEHHRHPAEHWTRLPSHRSAPMGRGAAADEGGASVWPPILRFLDGSDRALNRVVACALGRLERCALRCAPLQRYLVKKHERSFRRLLGADADTVRRAVVVGGGLFPRTALVLERLLDPAARIVLVDASAANLAEARAFLARCCASLDRFELVVGHHHADDPVAEDADLVVLPLAFVGDRDAVYRRTGEAVITLVHDWIWRARGSRGVIVSPWLLKRLNRVSG